ncbi:MAG: T9SS type A sorting domain-containing protein [Bacteroidia bacterium]|nr:T9SS type A sorting domain-containing protein [Bacteroidia bacterium]
MKQFLVLASFLFCGILLFAQQDGLPSLQSNSKFNPLLPADGTGTLGWIYNNTVCGLDYVSGSVKTGQRNPVNGTVQPAAIAISGIPSTAVILKAYLWTGGPSSGMNVTATLTNPLSQSGNFNMTMIGQGPDICWGYPGTYHYRADVTSLINGNGTYYVSGLPTNPPSAGNDMNGATLLIIYNDPGQTWQGTLIIKDGCITSIGVPVSDTISNYSLCMNSLGGKAFTILSDLQMTGTNVMMNNSAATYTWNWWNFIEVSTNYIQNQTTTNFNILAASDCFSTVAMGTYFRHTCINCCLPTFTATATSVHTTCNNNGTSTANITGGTPPYTYLWNTVPAQTTQTATGLSAGIWSCYITDANGCITLSDTILNNGVSTSISGVNPSCTGTGSATVSATGGSAPYTYAWSTIPVQTGQTATNLSMGTYTVTVTDAGGCTSTASVTLNAPTPSASVTGTSSNCGPNGVATANVTGGNPPYSYSWNTVPVQTNAAATGLNPGNYTVTVTDAMGCTTTGSVQIIASTLTATATASPTSISCGGNTQLNVTSNHPNCTYSWTPALSVSCNTCQNPVATPTSSTFYMVTVTSACGSATASVYVTVGLNNPVTENTCEVTVDTSLNKNVVVWERNVPSNFSQYRIYKETSPNNYTVIGSQPVSIFTSFVDLNSNPFIQAERYRIATVDSCGAISALSVAHRTIHLTVTNGPNNSWDLNWNAYSGFVVSNYEIYRGTNNSNMSLLATVPGNTLNYSDLTPPTGTIQYLITAQNPAPCNPSLKISSGPWMAVTNTLSNVVAVVTAGIGEWNPNAVHLWIDEEGILHYSSDSPLHNANLAIYDLTGKKMVDFMPGAVPFIWKVSGISAGIYFIRLQSSEGTLTRKIRF